MTIDYNKEYERLESFKLDELGEFWKPGPGQHKVKALGELEETDPFTEEGKEPSPQAKLEMITDDRKVIWTIPVGKTLASAYGQLCQLAKMKGNGSLKDLEFMVVVTNDGKKNTYTIVTV